jgi:proteic killer suppression protein
VIGSFADRETRALFEDGKSRRWNSIVRTAVRKLVQVDSVNRLDELNAPPGNRLEALRGDRRGSIAFASAANGAFVFGGRATASTMWKLWITTEWR